MVCSSPSSFAGPKEADEMSQGVGSRVLLSHEETGASSRTAQLDLRDPKKSINDPIHSVLDFKDTFSDVHFAILTKEGKPLSPACLCPPSSASAAAGMMRLRFVAR